MHYAVTSYSSSLYRVLSKLKLLTRSFSLPTQKRKEKKKLGTSQCKHFNESHKHEEVKRSYDSLMLSFFTTSSYKCIAQSTLCRNLQSLGNIKHRSFHPISTKKRKTFTVTVRDSLIT